MIDNFREFIVVAAVRNFAKAAEQLHMEQSTLRRHILELERYLGFKLFERNPVTLTKAGAHCLQLMEPAIAAYDKALENSIAFAKQDAEQITAAFLPSSNHLTGVAYESFNQLRLTHPNLTIKTLLDATIDTYDAVLLGLADVAFLVNIPDVIPEGFVCEPVGSFNVQFWGHRKSALYKKQPITPDDIQGYALVASPNKNFQVWFDLEISVLKKLGITPPVHIRELNTLNEFALTIQPDEIMITESNVKDPSANVNPDHLPLEWGGPNLTSEYCLFYAEGPKAPLMHELAQYCRNAFEAIPSNVAQQKLT